MLQAEGAEELLLPVVAVSPDDPESLDVVAIEVGGATLDIA